MDILETLASTQRDTRRMYDLPAAALERRYGPGKWTVRQILQHLSDAEAVYYYRIRRVISQPGQVIWATEQDAWARALDYATAPMDVAGRLYVGCRDALIETARHHYAGSDVIACVHSER